MSLPGCNYAIHSLDKNHITTFIEFRHLPENLEVKCIHLFPHTKLRNISIFKVLSLLAGVSLTSLIVMSYVLLWHKMGIELTPSPFQLREKISSTTSAPRDPSENHTLDMIALLHSKLDYPPRKLPEDVVMTRSDPHLFSVMPQHFLPEVKSPCWYEEVSFENSTDPYSRNHFKHHSKSFSKVCDYLKKNFQRHLHQKDGKKYRLRCLPYFYIIGQPKCGTTDLFHRLLLHPELRFNTLKEPHWWTRKRFVYNYTLEDYLALFDLAAQKIQEGLSGNSSGQPSTLQLITGESSASTMWDNRGWTYLQNHEGEQNLPFLTQDFIHKVQPNAKIIIMLRDPTERLYSDYLYFSRTTKSAEDFHQKALESMLLFRSCLLEKSLRSCVYSTSLSSSMSVRLNLGIYIVFILDWLTVFHKDQILILRLEDYSGNIKGTINKVLDFLTVGSLSKQVEAALTKQPKFNTRRVADQDVGPMLPVTRDLLRGFHQPFNQKLAQALDNNAFLWDNS